VGKELEIKKEVTPHQRALAEEYLRNGGHGGKAYKAVYATSMKDQYCANEASNILKKPHVKAYLDELRADSIYRTKSDYYSLLTMAHELIAESRANGQMRAAMSGLAELNKMTGAYRHRTKQKDDEGSQHNLTIQVLDNGKVKQPPLFEADMVQATDNGKVKKDA